MEPILHSFILVMAFVINSLMDAIDFSSLIWRSKFWDNFWHCLKYFLFIPMILVYGSLVGRIEIINFLKDIWHPSGYMLCQGSGLIVAIVAWQFSYKKIFRPWCNRLVNKYK